MGEFYKGFSAVCLNTKLCIHCTIYFLIAVAIGAGVSLGVVPRRGQKYVANQGVLTSFSNITEPSICRTDFCVPVLSIAQLKETSTTILMAREAQTNRTLWRRAYGQRWATNWEDLDPHDTFETSFLSPLTAYTMSVDSIGVVGITTWHASEKVYHVLVSRQYIRGTWDKKWYSLSWTEKASSPAAVCPRGDGKVDYFMLSRGVYAPYNVTPVAATLYGKSGLRDNPYVSGSTWYGIDTDASSSMMAVDCTNSHTDIAYLKNDTMGDQQLFHQRWVGNSSADDGPPKVPIRTIQGGFKGRPVIVTRGDQFDVLPVGSNNTLYHAFEHSSGISGLQSLELEVESTPFVLKFGNDSRFDVIVVGTDDRLKHRAYINDTWSRSWQDLGGVFFSAPVAVTMAPNIVTAFGITQGGQLIRGSWTFDWNQHEWIGSGNWTLDSGTLSMNSLKVASI